MIFNELIFRKVDGLYSLLSAFDLPIFFYLIFSKIYAISSFQYTIVSSSHPLTLLRLAYYASFKLKKYQFLTAQAILINLITLELLQR